MLTLVGEDRPGIVAKVTAALYEGGCNLGETSMMRLGGNFTIMMMADYEGSSESLKSMLKPVTESLSLRTHVDLIEGKLHSHIEPDVRITLFGADRAGIVAQATGALAEAGLNILHLESDVGGTEDDPIYIMNIEGVAQKGIDPLRAALAGISKKGVRTSVKPIDTLIA
jgi:glycine cleavage system transcriptional repressor